MEQPKADTARPSLATRLLLRGRFGQRLLLLFAACTLIPTVALGILALTSTAGQLKRQSWERLTSAAGSSGRTVLERIEFLATDLRKSAARLPGCGECASSLLYAADEVTLLRPGREPRQLAGSDDDV